jgi:hypothetical protein
MFDQNLIIGLVVLAVVVMAVYSYAPKVRSMLSGFGREGFSNNGAAAGAKKASGVAPLIPPTKATAGGSAGPSVSAGPMMGAAAKNAPAAIPSSSVGVSADGSTQHFTDYNSAGGSDMLGSVPMAAGQKPAGCYPREQINPSELLPQDNNSMWAQMNPAGAGDIQGKNFLSAGALIGVNTIGQSLRNANYQLRSEPPNPQMKVGPWMQSTVEPDLLRRSLE